MSQMLKLLVFGCKFQSELIENTVESTAFYVVPFDTDTDWKHTFVTQICVFAQWFGFYEFKWWTHPISFLISQSLFFLCPFYYVTHQASPTIYPMQSLELHLWNRISSKGFTKWSQWTLCLLGFQLSKRPFGMVIFAFLWRLT